MQVGSEEFLELLRKESGEIHEAYRNGQRHSVDEGNWTKKLVQLQNYLTELEDEKKKLQEENQMDLEEEKQRKLAVEMLIKIYQMFNEAQISPNAALLIAKDIEDNATNVLNKLSRNSN